VLTFIVRRSLLAIPTLIGISIVSFIIMQLPPGDFLTSYAATPAERQSRRCRALVSSPEAVAIWNDRPTLRAGSSAVTEWELSNDSGMLAAGILGAITSARADLLIIDDPVANREEADSETIRRKILQEYQDSLLTRLKPRGSVIIIQTRWHMDDLAGSILPEDYAGESGPVKCRDGNTWDVLNIPAKCEREDDPVGRKIGEYLWPEWFDAAHWRNYESNPRTWSSLYQQRPQPDSGGQFEREWFQWYDEDEIPERLKYYGASDFAVTEKALKTNPDYSEHGIFGLDDEGDIWVLDWYFGQEAPDETLKEFVALVKQWRPRQWFDEGGVIRRAIEPLKKLIMRAAGVYIAVEYLPSTQDKIARVASFRGRASAGCVHLPRNKPWAKRLLAQLCSFPFARYDDAVDVCGNFGRGLDQMSNAKKPEAERDHIIKPFTRRHIENKGWDREEEDTRAFYR